MQEGRASVYAVCPHRTGCTHVNAATDSYDQTVTRVRQASTEICYCQYGALRRDGDLGELALCVGAGCTDNAVATQVSRPDERRHLLRE
jgi:hypothetical protein